MTRDDTVFGREEDAELIAVWTEAAAATDRLAVRAVPDGVLLTLAPMASTFLVLQAGPWEQLTASLDARFGERSPVRQGAVLGSLARMHAFTLGARAAVDRQGALVIVSDRAAARLDAAERRRWVFSVQVVANACLSVVAATHEAPLPHDEAQALLTQRPS